MRSDVQSDIRIYGRTDLRWSEGSEAPLLMDINLTVDIKAVSSLMCNHAVGRIAKIIVLKQVDGSQLSCNVINVM